MSEKSLATEINGIIDAIPIVSTSATVIDKKINAKRNFLSFFISSEFSFL